MLQGALRSEFDLDPAMIYLNSGTHSICPRSVTAAVIRHLHDSERNPTDHLVGVFSRLWEVQKGLARFLRSRPEDLFFRANVTSAMNSFILEIPLNQGGEILLSDSEYGAIVNICRFRAERDGLALRTFDLPGRSAAELESLTEEALAERVVRELRAETRMVVLSQVMTGLGLRLPIERIARETRRRGILLAIDGAHATGALPLDFSRFQEVDFYGGNLHKWVMGPKGTGFGWVHPMHQAALEPREAGWTTFEGADPHGRFAPGHRFAQKHLISGSIDYAPYLGLAETFDFWQAHGEKNIQGRLCELQACVIREMKATGWTLLAPQKTELRGPLLAYELPRPLETLGYELMMRLWSEHRLQISTPRVQGRSVLRLSPHVYNTEEEIARAARTLAQLKA